MRRIDDAAGRAASERARLRAAEDELAGGIVELQSARERAGATAAEPVVVCPFKGLAPFDAEDAAFFFGRERLVAELVARLAGAPLMGIVGPSGSGKSSALRAGLLPALAEGVLPGSERWALVLLRPGAHPVRALEDAVAAAAPQEGFVIAVDQFEEVFTACRDEGERAAFADALIGWCRHPRRRARVLIAIRADFYGRCASYPELWRALGANQSPVGPMRRHELRRAIELPAHRAGARVEPELTDALIADVEGAAGALPLLSTSLLELWPRRDGRTLRLAAYELTGGLRGAVARLAEGCYQRLDASEQRLARAILLRLAGDAADGPAVRTRVPLAAFGEEARPVVATLTDSRLLSVSEGHVEVAHEALLREWPRLRGWLEEDAEGRHIHHHLRDAARGWDAAGRDPGELYRGARLASALEWSVTHGPELNAVERDFLADGRRAGERSHRRLRAVLAGVVALLVLALVAGLVALDQRGTARDEALSADAQRLGASALTEDDLDRSLLLARQGVALQDTTQTRSNLLAALLRRPAAIGVIRTGSDRILSAALSPDERTLALGDVSGRLVLVDARTRRRIASLRPTGGASIFELAFSPDGSRLAVGHPAEPGEPATFDPTSVVTVLDARSHAVVTTVSLEQGRPVSGVSFSPDGRTIDVMMQSAWPDGASLFARYDAGTGRRLLGPRRVTAAADRPC